MFLEQEQQKERALEMHQGRILLPREKKSIALLYFIYTVYASRLIILPLMLSENILVQNSTYPNKMISKVAFNSQIFILTSLCSLCHEPTIAYNGPIFCEYYIAFSYLYMCGMCAHVYVHAYICECMCMCTHLEAGGQCQVLFCMLYPFYIFEIRPLTESGEVCHVAFIAIQ